MPKNSDGGGGVKGAQQVLARPPGFGVQPVFLPWTYAAITREHEPSARLLAQILQQGAVQREVFSKLGSSSRKKQDAR